MNDVVEVKMGGLESVEGEKGELNTFVGSCVAICLFDQEAKVAVMAHVMLPNRRLSSQRREMSDADRFADAGKYADEAFPRMMGILLNKGALQKNIKAKIAGGAIIFSHESETGIFNIGPRNLESIRKILTENGIPLVSEDVGLNYGRWVQFNSGTGEMVVTSSLKKTRKII